MSGSFFSHSYFSNFQSASNPRTNWPTWPRNPGHATLAQATQAAQRWPGSRGQGQHDLGQRDLATRSGSTSSNHGRHWARLLRTVTNIAGEINLLGSPGIWNLKEIWVLFIWFWGDERWLYNGYKLRLKDSISSWSDVEKMPHQTMKIESMRLNLLAKIESLILEMLINKLVW